MEKDLKYYIKHPDQAFEISESTMKDWLERYPYSAAIRMLKARKSLDGMSPSSRQDIIDAADYVNDPLFLYYQLLKDPEKEAAALEAVRSWKEEEVTIRPVTKKKDMPTEPPTEDEKPVQSAPAETEPSEVGEVKDVKEEEKAGAPPEVQDQSKKKEVERKKQEVVKAALKTQKSAPKTFTDWLSSLEPVQAPGKKKKEAKPDKPKTKTKKSTKKKKKSRLDKLISQSIAEKEEAISETYADLLISQGYTEKAREVLEQLRLKFPEKSGYFAAKIEELDKD